MKNQGSYLLVAGCLAVALIALTFVSLFLPPELSAAEKEDLSDLWIDLSLGPPLIELFNERAQAGDLARVEHISQLELLQDVTTGKKLVVFKSADDAIRLLPHIHDEIDIVGYNLEHGPANPMVEQDNPTEYAKRLRKVVDEYELELAIGPDHAFALSHAAELAPYADYMILQIQKVQTEPETVYDFVRPILRDVRRANPDIQASVQIRTEGDVDELLEMLAPLEDELDGISILTSEETIDVTQELMGELRAVQVQPTSTPTAERELPMDVVASGSLEELASDNPITATIVATAREGAQNRQELDDEDTNDIVAEITDEANAVAVEQEVSSTPETNQRNGSTWLFLGIALVVGFAMGAGYVSYKTSA